MDGLYIYIYIEREREQLTINRLSPGYQHSGSTSLKVRFIGFSSGGKESIHKGNIDGKISKGERGELPLLDHGLHGQISTSLASNGLP